MYRVAIKFEAEFTDFEQLSTFLDKWALEDGVEVGTTDWDVTEENRRTYEAALRSDAVADATAKAQAYATAAGRGTVRRWQLADPGMLGNNDGPRPLMARMASLDGCRARRAVAGTAARRHRARRSGGRAVRRRVGLLASSCLGGFVAPAGSDCGAPRLLVPRRLRRARYAVRDRIPAEQECSAVASVIDTVVNLAKRRGLVFQSGEIYGGTKSAWDYGPLGVELKENIKRQWWRSVVTSRDDVVGLDSAIILPREVWVASGHVEVFNDPLVECLNCHKRHRQDHMQEAYAAEEEASTTPTRCR